jgi:hypothetical protein
LEVEVEVEVEVVVEVVRFVLRSAAPYRHYINNKNQAHLLNLLLNNYHLYEVEVEVEEVEVEEVIRSRILQTERHPNAR